MQEDEETAVDRQPRGAPETTQKGERTHFHDWGSQWCQLGRDYSTQGWRSAVQILGGYIFLSLEPCS